MTCVFLKGWSHIDKDIQGEPRVMIKTKTGALQLQAKEQERLSAKTPESRKKEGRIPV